jgi:Zn finger protein HypA/HybF involved in hydrogenase expression
MNTQLDELKTELENKILEIYLDKVDQTCTSSDSSQTVARCWCPDCKSERAQARRERDEAFNHYLGR